MDEGVWIIEVALYLEIWWELTSTWSQNYDYKNIGGFKFGSLERDCHMCISKCEILGDFNMAVAKVDHKSAKSNSAMR